MSDQRVTFSVNQMIIHGNFLMPRRGLPCIVLCHGLEGYKDSHKWSVFANRFAEAGFATLRFNFRGCGDGSDKSDGDFEDSTLTSRIEDFQAALDFVSSQEIDTKRIGAVGSSLGGAVVVAAADLRVQAMVLLATPAALRLDERQAVGDFVELPSGRKLRRGYSEDAEQYDLPAALNTQSGPVLVIHGGRDQLVPLSDAQTLYENATGPKKLTFIPGGSHSFEDPVSRQHVVSITIRWMQDHLLANGGRSG